nr:hypothetical protein [Brucella intermedia]
MASVDIEAVIPTKSNRRQPIPHDKAKYKWRNQIERLFNKLKNWRRVATAMTRPRNPNSVSSQSLQSNYGYPLSTSAKNSAESPKSGGCRLCIGVVCLKNRQGFRHHIGKSPLVST